MDDEPISLMPGVQNAPRTIIRPTGKRVLVQRVQAQAVSKGGVVLPDEVQAREKPNEGVVLAIGNECGEPASPAHMAAIGLDPARGIPRLVPFQPGDTVLFGAYAGLPLAGDESSLLILGEDEIVAVRMAIQSDAGNAPDGRQE